MPTDADPLQPDCEKPKRIERKRVKGWGMPHGAIYVGRPTRFGNPFRPGWQDARRSEWHDARKCVELFKFTMCRTDRIGIFTDVEMNEIDLNILRGHDLACWCPLDQPCHADVLLELANE